MKHGQAVPDRCHEIVVDVLAHVVGKKRGDARRGEVAHHRTVLVLLHRARVQRGERVLVRIVGRVELDVGPSAELTVGAAHEALEARLR